MIERRHYADEVMWSHEASIVWNDEFLHSSLAPEHRIVLAFHVRHRVPLTIDDGRIQRDRLEDRPALHLTLRLAFDDQLVTLFKSGLHLGTIGTPDHVRRLIANPIRGLGEPAQLARCQ